MYTYENYKFKFSDKYLERSILYSKHFIKRGSPPKASKATTLLRRAAKSFLEDHHANIYLIVYTKNRPFIIHQMKYLIYNFSTYNALSILHIDWNHKGMGRRKAQYTFPFLYAHYAYTPINYMKIEIILFYSVQIYRILYN